MRSGAGTGRAFWTCIAFTLLSALVSAAFSLLAMRRSGGHEYALYAASRSIALPIAVIYSMVLRSRHAASALATAMTIVQFLDGLVGFELRDPGRAYGPLLFAGINAALLLWMNRRPAPALDMGR